MDLCFSPDQFPHELGRLISGNTPRNAKNNISVFEHRDAICGSKANGVVAP
jgi:hypothetical protein